ncbi:threonine ammonia-lyase [Bacillus seohaeanensis]|uniref:L-threonine dehydratase catabolic TdcB n=1 Tax=Bacillus seohaeanensis TaxID=284580 RepID=A0ABW5RQ12_9BACI
MERIIHMVHRTPLKQSKTLNAFTGAEISLKMENLQRTGSFKLRGAMNKVMSLKEEEAERGIIAASAGNHAQGVALAASLRNIPSKIFMPKRTPSTKVAATRHYGAEIILEGETYQEAYLAAEEERLIAGSTYVHAFDDPKVMAGQGTVALEMLQQCSNLEVLVVPVGGGGLLAGMALAVKSFNPHVKIIGVQALGAPATYNRFRGKASNCGDHVHSIADGILVKEPGKLTFPIIEKYVDDMVTVTDEEISYGIMFMLQREKTLVEGAGAASLAAVLCGKLKVQGKKVGCVISGGNADPSKISIYKDLSSMVKRLHYIG